MIQAHPWRHDWFKVDFSPELGALIGTVPGVAYVRGKFEVHRTHLGLLPSGAEMLASIAAPYRSHVERDGFTAGRGLTLRLNQQSGLDFIEPRRGVLCADEMRLGKTLTALLAHDPSKGPLVVVAPLSTRLVWLEWIRKLWPDVEPAIITGTEADPDKLTSSPILFGHYDILTHHQVGSLRPGTLIVDEAHVLSNPKSLRSKAILYYASVSWRVILLTGTPLWNTSEGLWTLLAACNPGAWGRPHQFKQRYCDPVLTEYGWSYRGISNEDEWILRRQEMLICRTWADVRSDLPPTQRTLELVDLDADAVLKVDTAAYEARRNETVLTVENLNYYRQATGIYKAELAASLAKNILDSANHVVVWAWHKKVVAAVAKRLEKSHPGCVFTCTGDDSIVQRERAIAAWRAAPAAALVLTIDVGQVGIDLSRAHHAIFAEIDWTPLLLSQAEMRTFSPDRPMSITYVVLNHEFDLMLVDRVLGKVQTGENIGFAAAGSTFLIPRAARDQREDDWLLAELSAVLKSVA